MIFKKSAKYRLLWSKSTGLGKLAKKIWHNWSESNYLHMWRERETYRVVYGQLRLLGCTTKMNVLAHSYHSIILLIFSSITNQKTSLNSKISKLKKKNKIKTFCFSQFSPNHPTVGGGGLTAFLCPVVAATVKHVKMLTSSLSRVAALGALVVSSTGPGITNCNFLSYISYKFTWKKRGGETGSKYVWDMCWSKKPATVKWRTSLQKHTQCFTSHENI